MLVGILLVLCLGAVWPEAVRAQEPDPQLMIPGQPYDVPEIKVYLIDEETNGPFANHEVYLEYFWGWDVLKHTAEADRMERLKKITVKGRTDADGMVVIPARLIIPARPQAPEGAEFSEAIFRFIEIEVQDSQHNCGLFIDVKDVDKYRGGSILNFLRKVPIWKRN